MQFRFCVVMGGEGHPHPWLHTRDEDVNKRCSNVLVLKYVCACVCVNGQRDGQLSFPLASFSRLVLTISQPTHANPAFDVHRMVFPASRSAKVCLQNGIDRRPVLWQDTRTQVAVHAVRGSLSKKSGVQASSVLRNPPRQPTKSFQP